MNRLQISKYQFDKVIMRSSIFLIIFQSCGIRFFSGMGTLLLIIIVLLNISSIKHLSRKEWYVLMTIVLFISIYSIYSHLSSYLYEYLLVLSSFFFIKNYQIKRGFESFKDDFIFVLHWIFIHAFCGYILYLALGFFFKPIVLNDMAYKSFMYIFYVSYGISLVEGLCRNVGFFWEPGLLQFFLNLYLFMLMSTRQCTKSFLLLISMNVLFTNSTTGLLLLLVNYIYYFLFYKKFVLKYLLLGIISIAIISPIIINNVEHKFSGKTQTSGQVRTRDMLIGGLLIFQKPLWGHGYYDLKYLIKNESVNEIDLEVMNEIFVEENGELSGGYTNGLLDLIIKFGVPISIFLFFLFFRNKLCDTILTRSFFFVLCLMTFFSEPITNTTFFYMILLSSLFVDQKQEENETDINSDCNI